MATARKLPSGSWRCQVFSHYENGKRIYKSFTCQDQSKKGKHTCEEMAAAWARDRSINKANGKTFNDAVSEYINSRRNTLSPRTIEDYERTQRLYLSDLSRIRIDTIRQNDIQKVIDQCAARLSPKTVTNIHSLISAVMRQERPDMAFRTSLPQRVKPNLTIPSDKDVQAILEAVSGTTLELPVMLAAFGPMREGEICALDAANINGNIVHICENMVRKTVNGTQTWIIRHPKSTDSDRFIEYPDFVRQKWSGRSGRIIGMNPNTLCKSFKAVVSRIGISGIRFHDLRHWCASTLHAQGVPDAYIMQRGGWSSDRVLKAVYRHTLSDYQQTMTDIANRHFQKVMQHEMQHEKEKTL